MDANVGQLYGFYMHITACNYAFLQLPSVLKPREEIDARAELSNFDPPVLFNLPY